MAKRESGESAVPTVDKSKYQEEVSPNSTPLKDDENGAGGSVIQSLMRKFSVRKKIVNEDPGTEDTTGTPTAKSPSSEMAAVGPIFSKLSTLRKSLTDRKRNKPLQKIAESVPKSAMLNRDNSKDTTSVLFDQEVPSIPLSVMEINTLIQEKVLEEAYLNLLSLRLAVQRERGLLGVRASSAEFTNKERDLTLLYKTLKDKVTEIVHQSCNLPSPNKELLGVVVSIIQEEEKRGDTDEWRCHWRSAVQDGVKKALNGDYLDSCKQNPSSITVQLELLGKRIVEQLENVKADLVNLYPPSFNVFETYVSSCHKFVGEHIKYLLQKVTEPKDLKVILDFINSYHSEKNLGSPSLQPEMNLQSVKLSDDLIGQVEKAYCDSLQNYLHGLLENIIITEREEVWKKKVKPKKIEDGTVLISQVHINICEMIKTDTENNGKINANLKKNVVCKWMEALQYFPKRFGEEFSKQSCSLLGSDLLDCCLYSEYHVAYINSFSFLKEHIVTYKEYNPGQVGQLVMEVEGLVGHLTQALLNQFRAETEPHLGTMMTKNWFSTESDFKEIINRIETYSGHSKSLRPLQAQDFANDIHYHVAKGYISQLLKGQCSCKGKRNDIAGAKIREQWGELSSLCREMGSTLHWLHPLGDHLSDIIEQEIEKEIKTLISPLVENYPDISKKQFIAVLNFRDNSRSFARSHVIQHFTDLIHTAGKSNTSGHQEHTFFSDIK